MQPLLLYLYTYIPFQLREDDGFPVNICNDCTDKLISAFDFKAMIIQSNTKLYNVFRDKGIDREKGLQDINNIFIKDEIFVKNEQVEQIPESAFNNTAILQEQHTSLDRSFSHYSILL